MAQKGYILARIELCKYVFKQVDPINVTFQSDFAGMKVDKAEYLQIFADAGWKLACSCGSWYYFYQEKTTDSSDLSIFNNNESKSQKYKRVFALLLISGVPVYYQCLSMLINFNIELFKTSILYASSRIVLIVLVALHFVITFSMFKLYRKYSNRLQQ